MTREGYIIVNRHWTPDVRLDMGMHTFATTAAEAWRRHLGRDGYDNRQEFGAVVQRWSDKGYGPEMATLTLVAQEQTPSRKRQNASKMREPSQNAQPISSIKTMANWRARRDSNS